MSTVDITKYIEELSDYTISVLQKLVRIPSVYNEPPYETQCQEAVADELRPFVDELDIWEPDVDALLKHRAFFKKSADYTNRPNVVGVIKGTGAGRSLILNAHIDVVGPGHEDQWTYGPWSGEIANGRIYGRGSKDCKAGIAVALTVAKALKMAGIKLAGDLIIQSVVDEEWGGGGSLGAAIRGYKADGGILLEGTGMIICPAARGGMAFEIAVPGRSAHPGESWKGVSAFEKGIWIYQTLKNLEKIRQDRLRTELFAEHPIFAPIVIGKVEAEDICSRVPEKFTMAGIMGYQPSETYEEARQELEDWVAAAAALDPWLKDHPPEVRWLDLNKEGAEIPKDHPFVTTLFESALGALGNSLPVKGMSAGCDLPHLTIYSSTPSVVFGPGGSIAHIPDEYVSIQELLDVSKVVGECVIRWCKVN